MTRTWGKSLFIHTIFSGCVALLAGPAEGASLLPKPWSLGFISEYERTLTTGKPNLMNWYITPAIKFGENDRYKTDLEFTFMHQIPGFDKFGLRDTYLTTTVKDFFVVEDVPVCFANRIYFPTSTQSREQSLVLKWRSFLCAEFKPVGEWPLTVYTNFRLQFDIFEYATQTVVSNPTRFSAEELNKSFKDGGLNDFFTTRLQVGARYDVLPWLFVAVDGALYLVRSYNPGNAQVLAGLNPDVYFVPYFTETVGVTWDPFQFSIALWHVGIMGLQNNPGRSAFSGAGTTLYVALGISV